MNDIDGIKLFSWAMKLLVPAMGIFIIIKTYQQNWKRKDILNRILLQLIVFATAGFILFFGTTWVWLRIQQGTNPEDLIPCIIAGIPGFFIGMLVSFIIDKENGKIKKSNKATQQPNRGDR